MTPARGLRGSQTDQNVGNVQTDTEAATGARRDAERITVRRERDDQYPWVARKNAGMTTTAFETWQAAMAYVDRHWGPATTAPTPPLDVAAITEKWLQVCGWCDAGMGMCTHPTDEDYRTPMLELVLEVERLRGQS